MTWTPGLALRIVKDTNALESLGNHLRMSTVFFFERRPQVLESSLIGSGVAADIHGTKVIFTAAHVLDEYRDAFANERVALSTNSRQGSFLIKNHTTRLISEGGDRGADAGLLVLSDSDAATYFNFANLHDVARASTIRAQIPPPNLECLVAGYPASLSQGQTAPLRMGIEVRIDATMVILAANVVEVDQTHVWLGSPMSEEEFSTTSGAPLKSLNGMSGGGCWSVFLDETNTCKMSLHGVHTATQWPRIRQTPIVHHLRLLSGLNSAMHDKVNRLWPDIHV